MWLGRTGFAASDPLLTTHNRTCRIPVPLGPAGRVFGEAEAIILTKVGFEPLSPAPKLGEPVLDHVDHRLLRSHSLGQDDPLAVGRDIVVGILNKGETGM